MIDVPKLNINYKDFIEITVCSIEKYDHLMNMCTDCPGKRNDLFPNFITYKRWVTANRADIICVIQGKGLFFFSKIG